MKHQHPLLHSYTYRLELVKKGYKWGGVPNLYLTAWWTIVQGASYLMKSQSQAPVTHLWAVQPPLSED